MIKIIWSDKILDKFGFIFESYMTNKWRKGNVYFKTDWSKGQVDIRSALYLDMDAEIQLKDFCQETFKVKTPSKIAKQVLQWAVKNLKYIPDMEKWNMPDYWQDGLETMHEKTGDCEDGAILIYHLLRLCGVPEWRFKLCAGYVTYKKQRFGHAYIIYCGNDLKWYVLDWCFLPAQALNSLGKVPHKDLEMYGDIWFTTNRKQSWTKVDTNISEMNE